MANSKDLRRRIRSIKNTSQITKAMEMVAATKMRRAQSQAVSSRPYNIALKTLLDQLLVNTPIKSPLLQSNQSNIQTVLVFSTDKSLCGALNTNLFRQINQQFSNPHIQFITVGQKGRQFTNRTNRHLIADFPNPDHNHENVARQLSQLVTNLFLNGETSEVGIIFPSFVSTLTQTPSYQSLLPIDPTKFIEFLKQNTDKQKATNEYLLEPDFTTILNFALMHFIEISIYQALLETKASEHSARMIAMQNATQNATDLVSDLTLTYNQIRQDAITNELLEISSAGAALEL